MSQDIGQRKAHHLDLCGTDDVAFRGKTTLLDEVDLLHNSFPEVDVDGLNLEADILGKALKAPIIIASMSGGTDAAVRFNKDLAEVAEEAGIAMGLGSMRPLIVPGRLTDGFFLRDIAPTMLLMANIGIVQARELSNDALMDLATQVGADAFILHLNPAQERIQPGGDRDFRGALDTLKRVAEGLEIPVIAKETGCGLSRQAAQAAYDRGVKWVDVSGAGGTSWVGVEALRAKGLNASLGGQFWDWGIPTAASLVQLADLPLNTIATGGIRHGFDVARAIALGAQAVGLARPFLMAHNAGGIEGLRCFLQELIEGLKTAMLLTGSPDLDALRRCPLILGPTLQGWIPKGSPIINRIVNPLPGLR